MRWALVAVCGAGCANPASVRIFDQTNDGWELVDVPIGVLSDLDGVRGGEVTFWVRSRVDLSPENLANIPGDGGVDAEDYVWGADPPSAAWSLSGDVAVANDFDTLAMFTGHVQLARVLAFYDALGVREEAVTGLDVHYAPYGAPEGNAMYLTPADAMVLLRPASFEEVPFSVNPGVLAHEVGHRVTYWELWDGRLYEALIEAPPTVDTLVAYRHLDAVGEGVSDYFGAAITGDPAFMQDSFPDQDRDLSVHKTMDPVWATDAPYLPDVEPPDSHVEGAVLAASLWAAGEEVGHDVVAAAVLETQRTLSRAVRKFDYQFGDFEVEVVGLVGEAACDPFLDAYAPIADRFAEVCP